jgi:pimeloyl-ACP methyl ester carboxylesterase
MTPIIYIRGYAGSASAVERAVESTYYGFNDGSTKIRVEADGRPSLHLFESPLVRLMKEHDYRDYFVRVESGRVVLLKSSEEETYPGTSLWIFRYYDETSGEIGAGKRKRIEELAADLAKVVDFVRGKTGAAQVDLVAHSMGGLVARSLIQRTWAGSAEKKVRRLFTYGSPHGGIHFRRGLGWAEAVRDLFGPNESDTFGPKRMRQFLNLPDAADDQLNGLGASGFPAGRCFSLVGTNFRDYEVMASKVSVGPGSDGLVMTGHAYIKGGNRAYVHRAHSGPYGLVNSEEGYQNLRRFLFGDTTVKVSLKGLKVEVAKLKLKAGVKLSSLLLETRVAIRGVPVVIHRHVKEEGSALPVSIKDLREGETLFRTFLIRGKRAEADQKWSRFQIEVGILPVFVKERRVFSDETYEGAALTQFTVQIGVGDELADGSRKLEWRWVGFGVPDGGETSLGAQVKSHRVTLPNDANSVVSGELVVDVMPW